MESNDSQNTARVLEKCDPSKQESLISENEVDPMDAEQTWPTQEELQKAEEEQKVGKGIFNTYVFEGYKYIHIQKIRIMSLPKMKINPIF